MKDVTIRSIDPKTTSKDILLQWAKLYCEIWKEEPWCEDCWKPEEVIVDLFQEMMRPGAKGFVTMSDHKVVVGFTHGYLVNRAELEEIAGSSLLDNMFGHNDSVFYIDELGVDRNYRGRGIAYKLTAILIAEAGGYRKPIILRTDTKAHAARHLYTKLKFKELDVHDAQYPDRTYWILEARHE
jgi:ribosomal protein S18 acetylase RimI-like enzyme